MSWDQKKDLCRVNKLCGIKKMTMCSNCNFLSEQIEYLRQELFKTRLVVSKQDGMISMLKGMYGNGSEPITHSFLNKVAEQNFTVGVFTSGAKSYANYVFDNIIHGRVVLANKQKKSIRYVSDSNNVIEESVVDFVRKILSSTQFKANKLYQTTKDSCVTEFCGDDRDDDTYAASTAELSKRFANMAFIRSCNNDFCSEVSQIIMKKLMV